MKRFRFTLLAIVLVLLSLGLIDLGLALKNTQPRPITAQALENQGLPAEWVVIEKATLDLTRAINLSGELPIEALFVPLADSADSRYLVWIETHDPELIQLVSRYETGFDTVFAKEAFFEENRERFFPQRDIRAMEADWISANPNKQHLLSFLNTEEKRGASDEELKNRMILLSEGKSPALVRGSFYFITGLAGLVLLIRRWRHDARRAAVAGAPNP